MDKPPPGFEFVCTVNGCSKKLKARGLCTMHYARKMKGLPMGNGETYQGKRTDLPPVERPGPISDEAVIRHAETDLENASESYESASSIDSRMFWASEMKRIREEVEQLKAGNNGK